MNIQKMKIADLNAAKYNPRKKLKPGDAEFEKLKRSIETFGMVEPPIFNVRTKTVVGGHQRLSVLKHLGHTETDVTILDISEAEEKALNIALNKISGEWDDALLTDLLSELQIAGFDTELTGFSLDELDKMFAEGDKSEAKDDDFDIDKAANEPPFVMLGDLWRLGEHRLLCGDATKSEDVARLMDGKKANLCVTDPPYNCDYTGGTGMKIINDKMKSAEFYKFLLAAFKNVYENLADGGAFYCFHSDAEKVNFFNACVDAGFHYSTTCIWVKDSLVLGRFDFHMRHEPVMYAFKNTAKHKFYGDRKQTTIWEFPRPKKSELHPTQKTIELIAYPVGLSSVPNGIVLDPFGGSGTTLMVCEQTDRICYMSELDPKYASVILRRYAESFGSDGISCERENEVLKYSDLVKVVGQK